MSSDFRWRQLLRIPAVVALLAATGQVTGSPTRALVSLQLGDAWRAWVPVVVLGAAAAAVIVSGRDRIHPPAILAVEALIGGLLGFVPAVQWVVWFGVAGIVGSTLASPGAVGFVQALAVVWFVTVVATAVRQRRAASHDGSQ